jgi:hypothetical protein
MRNLLLILIMLCTGCVSTGDMRDSTQGAAQGLSSSIDSANEYELTNRSVKTREMNAETLNKLREQLQIIQSQ